MKTFGLTSIFVVGLTATLAAADGPAAKTLYENNFQTAEVDKVPDDFMVLDGAWAVKAEGTNKFLELPGAPLETYGVLFGPNETAGVAVGARAFGTSKGRRFPTFAVGLNGVGGFRLQVAPAKRQLELFKGDEVVASAPFTWEPGTWTRLRLQVRKVNDGEWAVEGRAWKESGEEPAGWQITLTEKSEPAAGRAAVWACPFSGTPIRFDDLKVTTATR